MSLCVVSCCYEKEHLTEILKESCAIQGLPLRFVQSAKFGGHWQGSMRIGKMEAVLENLPELSKEFTHVLWSDGYDTFACHDEAHIMAQYVKKLSPPILFSGEKNCWPDPGVADRYPASHFPWRFINAGTWMAEVSYLAEALRMIVDNAGNEHDDQRLWTHAYLGGILPGCEVDVGCAVFQTMWGTELYELVNPSIVHYNGGIWRYPQDRRYIDHWAATKAKLLGE